ncbi:MAG TPA: F0F1 ATP synthase subunit B [Gemmatimonadaceae bacterium]|jgi:F-type H+-transporting ATPase subunit b|nr:F0F1 ATP synthase subunit B [Gemmatimonadaceae bacterium]
MRTLSISTVLIAVHAGVAAAQEGAAPPSGGGLMTLQLNLMFWTLGIFVILYILLRKFAFGPITAAVEAREKALEDAIEGAKRDRDAAAKLLAEHQARIEAARGEAQKLIADGRALAEKMRGDLLEQTRKEQQDMLSRARHEIEREKERAIAQLRREAVDLALAGASKVIEQNLESEKNRQLVERYLSSIGPLEVGR